MRPTVGNRFFPLIATAAVLSVTAGCQTSKPAAAPAAKPAIQLQPYTAPDQTASAGIPAGWKVVSAAQTVITIQGPNGETVVLGNTVIAHNGPFQLGQRPGNGIDISMPNSTPLEQKLIMIIQQGAAVNKQPIPQITFDSASPLALPPALGQCGRFVASATGNPGPMKMMGVFCSLPVDAAGNYKTMSILAQAPAAVAAQSAPTAQAIFQSYRIPPAWLQKKLAPYDAAPAQAMGNPAATAAAVNALNSATIRSMQSADTSFNCFDLSVLRETPTYQLPRSCGGTKPD